MILQARELGRSNNRVDLSWDDLSEAGNSYGDFVAPA